MTIYAHVQDGDGKAGPTPGCWTPWINCRDADQAEKRAEVVRMIAEKFIRDNGLKLERKPRTFTVFTYASTDPLHPNGRPQVCRTTTFTAWPDETD